MFFRTVILLPRRIINLREEHREFYGFNCLPLRSQELKWIFQLLKLFRKEEKNCTKWNSLLDSLLNDLHSLPEASQFNSSSQFFKKSRGTSGRLRRWNIHIHTYVYTLHIYTYVHTKGTKLRYDRAREEKIFVFSRANSVSRWRAPFLKRKKQKRKIFHFPQLLLFSTSRAVFPLPANNAFIDNRKNFRLVKK